ncbi:Hypothetical Protein FCC1311_012152 [Hondaea fermentalgiana]|uniref:AP2/ERF domain-containing protein n=1 Tax=Hondaea fermentalgiana TaxID=2315210 RepID=A0A2R5G5D8_9STRA|nr:Hypothetical Protein FCC1311_012152 [Hondaea fermentalgiana]|eukprot:GBG24998.1 Hypothetical Protein FCC1311_012152 [Hondaea fermentalgiana]
MSESGSSSDWTEEGDPLLDTFIGLGDDFLSHSPLMGESADQYHQDHPSVSCFDLNQHHHHHHPSQMMHVQPHHAQPLQSPRTPMRPRVQRNYDPSVLPLFAEPYAPNSFESEDIELIDALEQPANPQSHEAACHAEPAQNNNNYINNNNNPAPFHSFDNFSTHIDQDSQPMAAYALESPFTTASDDSQPARKSKRARRQTKRAKAAPGKPNPPRRLTSRFRGVCWYKRTKRWVVQLKMAGLRKHVGYFKDELKAAQAYEEALREIQLPAKQAAAAAAAPASAPTTTSSAPLPITSSS